MSHKIALKPNNKQETYLKKAAGTARFAYNWALSEWSKQYELHKEDPTLEKPSQLSLRRQLNAIKREKYPWMLEVTKNAPQMAIIQLGEAFKNFFAKRAAYPKYRKKGSRDRFKLTNDQFIVESSRIRIPKLGWVRMREELRFAGIIQSATISRVADKWFVSINVDTKIHPKAKNHGVVGVDLGVSSLATLSTGETIEGPKALTSSLKKLKSRSKALSRKQKGSRNRLKAKMELSKLHARISNIRNDALHKLTTNLVNSFDTIVIEDLNVRGMIRNRHLSRSISDMGFYEFRRQLEYKTLMQGIRLMVADRWFASSKLCSHCGYKNEELLLSIREWLCPVCKTKHNRDHNAAINLKNLAVSSTVSACGEEGSGFGHATKVKPASVKQEVNTIDA